MNDFMSNLISGLSTTLIGMLIVFFGLLVQIAVTEIPFFAKAFSLVSLSSTEWLCMIAVSLIPLLMHEIMVLVRRKR